MKLSTDEIGASIAKRQMIFFETIPMDFGKLQAADEDQVCSDKETSLWNILSDPILDPRRNLKDLIMALDKIEEITEYEKEVQKAFTKGAKPPLKFSH